MKNKLICINKLLNGFSLKITKLDNIRKFFAGNDEHIIYKNNKKKEKFT